MVFKSDDDDYDYKDNDDDYDPDNKYRDIDEDDDSDESLSTSGRFAPRPSGIGSSGSLPGAGSSRFGNSGAAGSSPTSSSPFGSNRPGSAAGGGTGSSSTGSPSAPFGSRSGSSSGSYGSGAGSSSPSSSSSTYGNRPAGSSSSPPSGGYGSGSGSPSSSSSSSTYGNRPTSSSPSSPSSSSSSFGSRPASSASSSTTRPVPSGSPVPSRPETAGSGGRDEKKDDKKGGFMGGLSARNPFGGKKDEVKKDDRKEAPRAGSLTNDRSDASKDAKKPGIAGSLGGLTSRFPGIGGKKEDAPKPAKKEGEAKGGVFGGLGGRLPFGGGAKPTDNKPAASGGGPASTAGNFTRPSGLGGGAAASTAAPAAKAGAFGRGDKAAETKKATKKDGASGGGLFSRVGNMLRPPAESAKPPVKPRISRAPVVDTDEGLTLDNWLDIVGVALLGGALLLTLSSLSGEQAAIRGLLRFFGELFGWGAFVVPLGMFAIGMWLLVRHFGDKAPSVDPIRVFGVGMGFIALLIIMQYLDSFSYPVITTPGLLEQRLTYSWQTLRAGGGAIGAQLYLFLITNVTEAGGVVVVSLMVVVALMLVSRSSASTILTSGVGMARASREGVQRRAAGQRARRQLDAEVRTQQAIAASNLAAAAADPSSVLPAPAPTSAIRINRGVDGMGQTASIASLLPATPMPLPAVPMPPAPPESGSGILGRIKNASPSGSGSLLGRFSRGGSAVSEPQPPPLTTPLPLDDTPLPMPAARVPGYSALADSGSSHAATTIDSAFSPFERPASSAPAASLPMTPLPLDDDEESRELEQRSERLNALRSGQTAYPGSDTTRPPQPPSGTALASTVYSTPSQLPSVQPTMGPQQSMLNVPLSSPVTNHSRAQRTMWKKPDFRTLLSSGSEQEFDREVLLRQAKTIEDTLSSFGAPGRVVEVNTGPVITQFGVEPDYVSARGKKQRVKVGAIAALDKDLQLALGAKSIRVEAPVPGKGYVGIEVPNREPATVRLRDVMESPGFAKIKSPLAIALGQSVSGTPISADLVSMPHVLIAGTTGSGKSVMVNAIICSIIARHSPDEVKFILVDPKRVELIGYNGIPHLVAPVVVELERIVGVLKWVTREMDDRYKRFSEATARNIEDYNRNLPEGREPMAYIVVIIDELADLMMQAPEETERSITRIAALARATGIHLVIATQRPSVDVVTGLIRANFPARIAFAVASNIDSRVILDQPGAEKLLGRGDMLYLSGDSPAAARLQGVFVSDMEINNLTRYWKLQATEVPEQKPFNTAVVPEGVRAMNPPTITRAAAPVAAPSVPGSFWESNAPAPTTRLSEPLSQEALTGDSGDDDDMYEQAVELVRRLEKASVSLLQRRLRIGYTRAARLIDMMEARNVVGPAKDGSSKPRDVLPLSASRKPVSP